MIDFITDCECKAIVVPTLAPITPPTPFPNFLTPPFLAAATEVPAENPSPAPSTVLSSSPTETATLDPSTNPTGSPTETPPTTLPTSSPITLAPSVVTTDSPTDTSRPSPSPSGLPTVTMSPSSTHSPSKLPTESPKPSPSPSNMPSRVVPTSSFTPSATPTDSPEPSPSPSYLPSTSRGPSISAAPTNPPSVPTLTVSPSVAFVSVDLIPFTIVTAGNVTDEEKEEVLEESETFLFAWLAAVASIGTSDAAISTNVTFAETGPGTGTNLLHFTVEAMFPVGSNTSETGAYQVDAFSSNLYEAKVDNIIGTNILDFVFAVTPSPSMTPTLEPSASPSVSGPTPASGIGRISGSVTNSTGDSIPDAEVTYLFPETNATATTTSDQDGQYNFVNITTDGTVVVIAFDQSTSASASDSTFLVLNVSSQVLNLQIDVPATIQPTLTNADFSSGFDAWEVVGPNVIVNQSLVFSYAGGRRLQSTCPSVKAGVISNAGDFNPVGSITQTFMVPNGTQSLQGRIKFLSNEWPVYFGSAYNDNYLVTLTTTSGTQIVSSNNLNSAQWSDTTILGYNGKTPVVDITVDLAEFVREPVTFHLEIRDVSDQTYDSALAFTDLRLVGSDPDDALVQCE